MLPLTLGVLLVIFVCIRGTSPDAGPSSLSPQPVPDPETAPPKYVLAEPGGLEGHVDIADQLEARRAADELGLHFDKPTMFKSARSNYRPEDPHGAIYKEDEQKVYFNIHRDNGRNKPPNRKVIYKRIDAEARSPGSTDYITKTLLNTGLLYHAFGFEQGNSRPVRYPEEVLQYWSSQGGLYQQSATYVDTIDNVLPTPVGIVLNPDDPRVTVHLMGAKDLYYFPAVKKYPSAGRLDQICMGHQGMAEASRAAYCAYNWRYVSFINGCYSTDIRTNHEHEAKVMNTEDDVKYFMGSPVRALRETRIEEQVLHTFGSSPEKSRKGVECIDCLWNEVIFSAPMDAILGVFMWSDDENFIMSEGVQKKNPKNRSGYWFKLACEAIQKMNPAAKCFHVYQGELYERNNGSGVGPSLGNIHLKSPPLIDDVHQSQFTTREYSSGQVPELFEDIDLLRTGNKDLDRSLSPSRSGKQKVHDKKVAIQSIPHISSLTALFLFASISLCFTFSSVKPNNQFSENFFNVEIDV